MQEFWAAHPELAGRQLYITGESYAGHYVPAVANRVYKGNKDLQTGNGTRFSTLKKILQRWNTDLQTGNGTCFSTFKNVLSDRVYKGNKDLQIGNGTRFSTLKDLLLFPT